MSGNFSFSFSGDDIEDKGELNPAAPNVSASVQPRPTASAFPVASKPLLPAASHDLHHMLSQLPSKVAYSILDIDLDGNGSIQLPRRELWDVRVQLMAEDEGGDTEPGLGNHDVKTGVYEGGFKSWESSVDLVKVLSPSKDFLADESVFPTLIELGCGTALPSLALFQWSLSLQAPQRNSALSIVLADYNPTVLQLVTLPNFILCWALHQRGELPLLENAFSLEGELDLTPDVIGAFEEFLSARNISISFFSGGWSTEFINLVSSKETLKTRNDAKRRTIIIGAETIYSPFALSSFTQTVFSFLKQEKDQGNAAEALVGAKKLYFGVGGSLDDFVAKARELGADVEELREETEGVRRGVVRCSLP
ncbi:uncharacterized protein GGS22DRAFT_151048 [Annulohypoxylon maeteangense]|uniref:uncharacterized protein n=1 Tax=Annulohypoxylon maeteangense TaxID=1927788 RepID=UPI002007CAE1|nr:uncharacterized protein GGS22DRAFT_151048 [Annulohypoxylon maeteangense]KAI0890498.1 hypothetical protein GGS22DRAFT_151048 [Annulohypoxylon maeteangense]